MTNRVSFSAYRLLGLQSLMVLLVAAAWVFMGHQASLSALMGGMACLLPNIYFARRFLGQLRSKNPQQIIKAFYLGELVKLMLSAVLLLLLIRDAQLLVLPMLTGFISAHFGYWFAPLVARSEVRVSNV